MERGQPFSDAPSMLRILREQLRSVSIRDDPNTPQKHLLGIDYSDIPLLRILSCGVRKLLASLNPRKALGPDEIPGRILQTISCDWDCLSYYSDLQPISTNWRDVHLVEEGMDWPRFQKGGRSDPARFLWLLLHIRCLSTFSAFISGVT